MVRFLSLFLLPAMLGACVATPGWSGFAPVPAGRALPAPSGKPFSFDWRLSGERAIAPLQVFDNGLRTWLQFAPGQVLPAIFARTEKGDVPVSATVEGAYAVLPAVWPEIVLRGGHLVAHARRGAAANTTVAAEAAQPSTHALAAQPAVTALSTPVPAGRQQASTFPAHALAGPHPASPLSVAGPDASDPVPPALPASMMRPAPAPAGELTPATSPFSVSAEDRNFRLALARWSGIAGWTFQPEHWAVDVDIPIAGSASFDADFKPAVRSLVASTELSERPLQPCFYANRVLRIVAYAQPCDRAAGTGASS